MKKTVELATQYEDWIINLRRHFHMYPEASLAEYETAKKIKEELDNLGIEVEYYPDLPAVIGLIRGSQPGKTVALRSDIDALCVTELTNLPFKSKTDGFMHACGHDCHAAINLGAARILNELKDEIHGTVLLLFQPGEEVALGAPALIKAAKLDERVDNYFGGHVWSNLESGKISVEAGPRMSSADRFTIKIQGVPGHGAQPHETVDATVVAAALVMNLQTLVSREFSPMDAVVVTVGKLTSGTRFNIISGEAVLEGTVRYFTHEIGAKIDEIMERVVHNTAATFRATAELEYLHLTYPVINDEASSALATEAVKELFGAESLANCPKTTGGEDFSAYLRHAPGCFAFFGSKNAALGTDFPHHSNHFAVDESVLKNGAALYAEYAIRYLRDSKA